MLEGWLIGLKDGLAILLTILLGPPSTQINWTIFIIYVGARRRVFLDSMSDLFSEGVEPRWIKAILEAIESRPDHTFLVLTKRPDRIFSYPCMKGVNIPNNLWIGVSVTSNQDLWRLVELRLALPYTKKFVSFEPLMGRLHPDFLSLDEIGWIIIGSETGNRKGKVVPQWSWISELIEKGRHNGVPVYVKDNVNWESTKHDRIQEFPKEMI